MSPLFRIARAIPNKPIAERAISVVQKPTWLLSPVLGSGGAGAGEGIAVSVGFGSASSPEAVASGSVVGSGGATLSSSKVYVKVASAVMIAEAGSTPQVPPVKPGSATMPVGTPSGEAPSATVSDTSVVVPSPQVPLTPLYQGEGTRHGAAGKGPCRHVGDTARVIAL